MSFIYRPAIHAAGYGSTPKTLSFPQPITDCSASYRYKGQEHEIPLKAGGISFGVTSGPAQLTISGAVAHDLDGIMTEYTSETEAQRQLWEKEMYTKLMAVKTLIDAYSETNPLEIFFIYDPSGGEYVKFKTVKPEGFDFNLGDGVYQFFSYQATFTADDPVIYATGPGV